MNTTQNTTELESATNVFRQKRDAAHKEYSAEFNQLKDKIGPPPINGWGQSGKRRNKTAKSNMRAYQEISDKMGSDIRRAEAELNTILYQ